MDQTPVTEPPTDEKPASRARPYRFNFRLSDEEMQELLEAARAREEKPTDTIRQGIRCMYRFRNVVVRRKAEQDAQNAS